MKLLSQEQRQEIRDLCRVIVRRNVELSADKVLQQLKSEYCCPEGRAPLPDVWTAHNIEIKTKRLDSNNYNCFYCTSNNTTIHNTLDPVRSLSKQPNTVQQYNKEKNWIGTREAECSTSSSDPPFNVPYEDFCLYLYCNETDTNCRFLREVPDAARWDGMLWAGACVFCRFSLIVEPSPVLFLSPCLDLWWCA